MFLYFTSHHDMGPSEAECAFVKAAHAPLRGGSQSWEVVQLFLNVKAWGRIMEEGPLGGTMAQVTPFDAKIVEYMRAHGAKRIGVFGSYARGEARADSDLDLLVWFSEQQSLLRLIRMERELSELVGIKIDLLTEQAISPYLIDTIRKELKDLPQ